jgi:hypothetical protein
VCCQTRGAATSGHAYDDSNYFVQRVPNKLVGVLDASRLLSFWPGLVRTLAHAVAEPRTGRPPPLWSLDAVSPPKVEAAHLGPLIEEPGAALCLPSRPSHLTGPRPARGRACHRARVMQGVPAGP